MTPKTIALAGLATFLLTACNFALWKDDAYALYRGNTLTGNLRIHIATFDSTETLTDYKNSKMSFNYTNCVRAAHLFQRQQPAAAGTRYWCEKGGHTK